MPPAPLLAIATVTPALQQVARLLHASPYAVPVQVPRERAQRTAAKLLERYPSAAAHRNSQSALRGLGLPAVRLLVMPPEAGTVTLLLLANLPADEREPWRLALDPAARLNWRGYEVATVAEMQREADEMRRPQPHRAGDAGRITWRLSRDLRQQYRQTITRTIHSMKPRTTKNRDGGPRAGTTRTPEGQRAQLEKLGQHLSNYPGLNGVNVDRWLLRRHMERLWKQQHPDQPAPAWPRFPFVRALPLRLAPLTDIPDQEQS